MSPKTRWLCAALLLGILLVGGAKLDDSTPSYAELKARCDEALSNSPRSESLDVWLNANRISSHRKEAPFERLFADMLVSNGIPATAVNRAATCTYFESLHVPGGFFSTHVAYWYFVFSADGSLIDYTIHDIYYGM